MKQTNYEKAIQLRRDIAASGISHGPSGVWCELLAKLISDLAEENQALRERVESLETTLSTSPN